MSISGSAALDKIARGRKQPWANVLQLMRVHWAGLGRSKVSQSHEVTVMCTCRLSAAQMVHENNSPAGQIAPLAVVMCIFELKTLKQTAHKCQRELFSALTPLLNKPLITFFLLYSMANEAKVVGHHHNVALHPADSDSMRSARSRIVQSQSSFAEKRRV